MTTNATAGLPTPTRSAPPDPQRSAGSEEPAFPEPVLIIKNWPDPVLDELGHDPNSHYAETFWVSIIGPSCYLALRRFVHQLEHEPEGFQLTTAELALELGLGAKGGRHGPLWRSIERMCHFKLAHRQGPILVVRRRLPPLSARQVKRMPDHLSAAHDRWQSDRLALQRRATIARAPHQSVATSPAPIEPVDDGDKAA